MSSSETGGQIPCVEQPALEAFDTDGDGVLGMEELRAVFPDNPKILEIVAALESHGVSGVRYTGCGEDQGESGQAGTNGAGEDLATLIARAAVAQLYADKK